MIGLTSLGVFAQQAMIQSGAAPALPIEFVGFKQIIQSSPVSSNFDGLTGGTIQNGDVFVICGTYGGDSNAPINVSVPGGKLAVQGEQSDVRSAILNMTVGVYGPAVAAEGFTVFSNVTGSMVVMVAVYRNVDPAQFLDVNPPLHFGQSNTNIPDPPAITPLNDNTRIVMCGVKGLGTVTYNPPADTTLITSAGGSNAGMYLLDRSWAPGGIEYDPPAIVTSGGNTNSAAIAGTIALRPLGAALKNDTWVSTSKAYVVRKLTPQAYISTVKAYVIRKLI